MKKLLTNLFNDGKNDGDLTIVCKDNVKINCHSFIMERVSEYIKCFNHFEKISGCKEINLDYKSDNVILFSDL